MGRTSREKAQAHAKHATYCSCGKVVHGNGGKYQHRMMHKRKADDHYGMAYSAWQERFRPYKDFGLRIYAARKAHNWSREMVAGMLGPPFVEDDIALMENGGWRPDSALGDALCRMFNLELAPSLQETTP